MFIPTWFLIGWWPIVLLVGGLAWWRKTRNLATDEMITFDVWLIGLVVGWIFTRMASSLLSLEQLQLPAVVQSFARTDSSLVLGLVGWYWWVARQSKQLALDKWQLWDYLTISVGWMMPVLALGWFITGSRAGLPTQLPWAIQFGSNVASPQHPSQLYWIVATALVAWYLTWVEVRYRRFEWYRTLRGVARPGFVTAVGGILLSIVAIAISFTRPAELLLFARWPVDAAVYLGLLLWSAYSLLQRAGWLPTGGARSNAT